MVLQDISDNGKPSFELENPQWGISNEDSLSVGKEKVSALKQAVKEMEEMIEGRKNLSNGIIRDGEKMKTELENFIVNRDPTDEDAIRERNGLRQKQVEISELQLKEKVSCWQDIARLMQELRETKKELTEKEERANTLGKILEDK